MLYIHIGIDCILDLEKASRDHAVSTLKPTSSPER